MKKTVALLLLFCVTLFFSCKKEVSPSSISGSWTLTNVQGGYMVTGTGEQKHKHVIKFNGNVYEKYVDDKLVVSSNYTLTTDKFAGTGKEMDAFVLENTNYKVFLEIKKKKLILYDGTIAADGTISTYTKN
ncbi:hypothetical protein ACSBL2_14815 [Pedobacter sp. AW31-3R]|uniref:hypothetical protein n=1 Tax=Pedobacter sp. AW31-3R TaxID=3445781 RepID=UPI003FA13AAF